MLRTHPSAAHRLQQTPQRTYYADLCLLLPADLLLRTSMPTASAAACCCLLVRYCVCPVLAQKKTSLSVWTPRVSVAVSTLAMPMSKEEKARRRALLAMEAGRVFHARGSSNKAQLHELRTKAAASSSKRIREEQIEAAPAAPAPAAPLAGEQEAVKQERVRPEAIELAAGSALEESVEVEADLAIELVPPPQREDASEADKLARLLATVRQLQALSDISGPLASFARARLQDEQNSLLRNWPLGCMKVDRMTWEAKREHKCKKWKEQTEKQHDADPVTAKVKLMRITWTLEAEDVMQPFRDEYYCAKESAYKAIASLQRLSLQVRDAKRAAHEERVGWAFHEMYILARKEWEYKFRECCAQELLDTAWLKQCAHEATLSREYAWDLCGRKCERPTGVLSWSPPFGVQE